MNIEKVRKLKPFDQMVYWIKERRSIRAKKIAGKPIPWTDDDILRNYRFCNVEREHDKVTLWIAKHWRNPHIDDPNLWFAMCVARLLNNPDTLEHLGYPTKWNTGLFVTKLTRYRNAGNRVFNSAYIVSTNGVSMDKIKYLASRILQPLWDNRKRLSPKGSETLEHYHKRLMAYDGLGSFMAAQVIADLKYVKPLSKADDWHTFAASGPGSRRGLNRVLGNPPTDRWKEDEWRISLGNLQDALKRNAGIDLHAQDVQNCCCEFDKYLRTLNGEGRPKSKYPGMVKL